MPLSSSKSTASYQPLALAAIITACILWGGSFLGGKIALRDLIPSHLILYRFVLATTVLGTLALLRKLLDPRPAVPFTLREAGLYALTGVLTVPVTHLLQFEGLARTTAASAALLVGTAPPLLALGGYLVFGERLGRRGWLAVALATVGLAVMVGVPGPGRTLTGDLLVVASMVASAVWVLLTKHLMTRRDPVQATALIMAFGTAALVPYVLALHGVPPTALASATWGALAFLGIGCTACSYLLWNWGLHYVEAARASVFVNLEPLVGAVLGVAVLHEPVGPGLLVGGLLILIGAWIVSTAS